MKELQNKRLIDDEFVPVYETDSGGKIVFAKELHESLLVSTRFNDWIQRNLIAVGFIEGRDFHSFMSKTNGRPAQEYILRLDTAKHIAMIQRSEIGMQIRQQFINLEKVVQPPKLLTEKEQLMASMKLSLETAEEIEEVKKEIAEVRDIAENQVTLDHGEQRRLQKTVAIKVYEIEADPAGQRRMFKELYREIKDRFAVASYKDVKRKDLQNAIRYVDAWLPRKVS